ncbi:hypothetical protein BDV96DRAFT_641938 [Lophiotrema nucula]|uniref:Cora-like Mg2+ transporter protein-domain-containing protein n=1 Tax=Lophiotrema nucula TaxID=690887 RepID=A0A6A5ZP95_9PLEO|nr:hypothetical protein BDV96DRAFT_641938 [Lophiotrema nucula]
MAPQDDDLAFKERIRRVSDRSSKDHSYPRPDLINLSSYLAEPPLHKSRLSSTDLAPTGSDHGIMESFACVYDIIHGDRSSFAASPRGLQEFSEHEPSAESSLIFLRGFASPQWLNVLGEIYDPNSELYRRHLAFQLLTSGDRDYFASPSLPSASARVFQLTIPTICTRNVGTSGYEPEDLQLARARQSDAMAKYFQSLRDNGKVADSVVRKCAIISKEEYILEQAVTVEVGPPAENWRAIIWLDNGRDLSQSVPGPWNPMPGMKSWETYFFPVIVHQATGFSSIVAHEATDQDEVMPKIISTNTSKTLPKDKEKWSAAQNICLLPFQYGSHLRKELASRDALYALSELFYFAASAEVQVLNLLDKRIAHELSFVGAEKVATWNSICLLNLKYIKSLLTSQNRRLATTVDILRNRHSLDWPQAENDSTVEKTANLLLSDFEHLLLRAEMLARECEQGMITLANSSVLEESRRSADTGIRVQRLTIIGTVFIPLSFVCSIWGTNFKEFGSGSKPVWMLFASTGPVILLSYLIYNWDAFKRLYRKKSCKKGKSRYPES